MASAAARKRLFVHHLVAGAKGTRGNQRKAAVAAGYSGRQPGIDVQLARLRQDPEVIEILNRHFERFDITDARILAEYARIAFSHIGQVFKVDPATNAIEIENLDELDDDVLAAVAEIKPVIHQETGALHWGVKMHPKLPALEFLAKLRGLIKSPDVNVLIIQALAGLDLSAYTTEELQTLHRLILRGLTPAPSPTLSAWPAEAKNITPAPPGDLPQNGHGTP